MDEKKKNIGMNNKIIRLLISHKIIGGGDLTVICTYGRVSRVVRVYVRGKIIKLIQEELFGRFSVRILAVVLVSIVHGENKLE